MVCKGQIWTMWLLCDELVVAAVGICWGRGQRNVSAGGKVSKVATACDYKGGCVRGWGPDTWQVENRM